MTVGFLLAAVQLVPFIQFSLSSGRIAEADYEFATDYSLPPAHLITFLVPEFFGEPSRVGYWSVPTFEELTYYAGILAILAIVLALRRPTRLGWFYLLLIIFGLWLALGRYGVLYELAYRFLPPFRFVRAPGRAAFLFLFGSSALLAHVLSDLREKSTDQLRNMAKGYWLASVGTLAIALVAALAATGAVFMAVHPTDTSGRLWHQIGGYSMALIFVSIGGALIWKYLTQQNSTAENSRQRRHSFFLAGALVGLLVADTWWFSLKMVRTAPTAPDPVWTDGRALVPDDPGRVLPWGIPLFSQNGAMQVGWPSVFGYDSLEPAAHVALASSVPDPRSTAYDILGATHVLAGGPLDEFTEGDRPLTLIGNQGSAWVYRRARPLPIARLAYVVEVIPEPAEAISRIHSAGFDPASTVILDKAADCDIGSAPLTPGTAEILGHESTRWEIRTRSDVAAIHVLAENAYPGWEATIDGQSAEVLTAYTSIRAVCVPSGEHIVEWRFNPRIYRLGVALTLSALILVGIALSRLRKARSLTGALPQA